jgi:hypothetical protein|tara:strand:+ start:604 stop:795 length:192 start_codon:yes stop_codon:yes gene_type:complete
MDYFSSDELDSVAFIEKKSNAVVLKVYGFHNEITAQLFITYSMMKLGFDFHPINDDMPSKMIH